ncbi:IS2 repressor TnpA [Serratia sp. DD3]|nr:IS2 repressor TnpA [Serratia sp. DD3]
MSHVVRLHGIQPSLLFKWKKQYLEGSLTAVAAGEEVVPASELATTERIPTQAGIVNLSYKSCLEMAGQDQRWMLVDFYGANYAIRSSITRILKKLS